MDELKFKSSGPDAAYLANINIFFAVLFTLDIFKNGWREDKLGSQSTLQKCADWFKEMFEGGRTGNRVHIAARKSARQDLDGRIHKIMRYLSVLADESDMKPLLNSGVVIYKTRKKARRTPKAVPS
ncbi:hypothetical protein KOM00_04015 [Geomonas sp. Red69]|uniref:Uncharacterized protein n=1 Tax=Geomonas diazotrophica TaxID=2843197 RepID=A0ABX8JGN1_9BACT|nr:MULTISPECIES: hypothetical protein [Geomonas]MBU5635891.1 hypothetical protein [Geomonas diazotrophica]QWV96913.1 hypothetical protein KP005_16405 [Geomonas nitrogeniifigens]QXE86089.1 hypothetical protein KP003_17255 [Geomonas nitrogeniifigens]